MPRARLVGDRSTAEARASSRRTASARARQSPARAGTRPPAADPASHGFAVAGGQALRASRRHRSMRQRAQMRLGADIGGAGCASRTAYAGQRRLVSAWPLPFIRSRNPHHEPAHRRVLRCRPASARRRRRCEIITAIADAAPQIVDRQERLAVGLAVRRQAAARPAAASRSCWGA